MTVSTETASVSYAGNGATTVFAVPFYFLENSHIRVVLRTSAGVESTKALTADYTVANAGTNPSTATVTCVSFTPATGQTLRIVRDPPLTQDTDYIENDAFPAETHEKALDKLTMIAQAVSSDVSRALKWPETSSASALLPDPASNGNRFLATNSGGTAVVFADSGSGSLTNVDYKFASVAAMSSQTGMANNAIAMTLGYYTANDGGHGTYRYDSTSTATVNGVTVINAAGGSGRWHLLDAEPNFNQAGAKGDNSTDDQLAIQSACTALAGRVIHALPGFIYKFNSNISVPSDTVIWAFGAKFNCSSGHFTAFTFVNGGGIIGAEEIKGAGNATYNANGVAIYCTGSNNHPSAPTFVNGPVVMYNKIKEWGSYGVYAVYCNKVKVDYNEFTKIGYSSLGGVSQNDGSFCNNYVNEVSPGSGGGDAYGAFFDRFNGTSEISDPRSYRCKMNGNTVRGVVATAANNGHALDTHGGVEIEFIGNNIEGCEGGIFVTSSTISGSEALAPKRCIVSGNAINCGLYNNYAVIIRGAINGAVVAEYADSNVVAGNTIFGGGVAGSNTTGAVMLQATKNTRIDIGSIMQSSPFGICLNSDNLNFNISGGTISDCFDGSVPIAGGVAVRGNNNKGFIGGISFKYETAGLGTYVMVNSIVISGGLTGLDIDMGRCYFEGIDASHLALNDGVGVNSESLYGHSKTESFTLTSGNSSTIKSVVFPKRFPVAPKISLTNSGAIAPGGKSMALRTSAITATGFDIIVYPYDLTTWSATATADINWRATT